MKIRGVVFDKDGTLFDFRASWSGWATNVLTVLAHGNLVQARSVGACLGFDFDAREFDAGSPLVAGTPKSILDELKRGFPDWPAGEIAETIHSCSINAEMVEAAPLRSLLGELRNSGYRLGVATNDSASAATAHLGQAGIEDCFDFIAGFDSVQHPKPEPDMLLAFCEETGIPPEESVMVGDSLSDIVAGINAHMRTVGVLTGGEIRSRLSPWADVVLNDVGALPRWLEGANE